MRVIESSAGRALGLITSCCLLLCLSACSAGTGRSLTSTRPTAGPSDSAVGMQAIAFPSPQQFAAPDPRTASADSPILLRQGAQNTPGLPLANAVHENDQRMVFAPDYQPGADSISGLAYACYSFNALGSDPMRRLRLDWASAPAGENLWLAISNWDFNRWEFIPVNANNEAHFSDDSAHLLEDDVLLVLVVLGGSEAASLNSIRLGALAPLAQISFTPQKGAPPLEVSFDASASLAGEGSITAYTWDFEGDGIFDHNSGTNPQVEHVYSVEGNYSPQLRVENSFGLTHAAAGEGLKVSSNWALSFGHGGADSVSAVVPGPDGDLFICGGLSDLADGPIGHDSFAARLSAAGELLWIRVLETDAATTAEALALDSEGNVIVSGLQSPNGVDGIRGFVQKWSSAGSLLWFRYLLGHQYVPATSILTNGTYIYTAGESPTAENSYDLVLTCIDGTGQLVWERTEGTTASEYCAELRLLTSEINPPFGLSLLGSRGGIDARPVRLDLSLEGDVIDMQVLECGNAGEDVFGRAMHYQSSLFEDPEYYIACTYEGPDGGDDGGLLFRIGDSGSSVQGKRFEGPAYLSSMHARGGQLLLAGGMSVLGQPQGWAAHFSMAGLSQGDCVALGGLEDAGLSGVLGTAEGMLIAGYAISAASSQTEFTFAETSASASWGDYPSSGAEGQIFLSGGSGEVQNPASILVYDEGAGQSDCYVAYLDGT